MAAEKVKAAKKSNYTYAVGRRKTAIARVKLFAKASVPEHAGIQLVVNGKSAEIYFPGETNKAAYRKPFILTETLTKMSASAVVVGGGKSAQLDAIVHGISRAIALVNREAHRPTLKASGLLTRDSRKRQRRMIGTGGKARRTKQSPKR